MTSITMPLRHPLRLGLRTVRKLTFTVPSAGDLIELFDFIGAEGEDQAVMLVKGIASCTGLKFRQVERLAADDFVDACEVLAQIMEMIPGGKTTDPFPHPPAPAVRSGGTALH